MSQPLLLRLAFGGLAVAVAGCLAPWFSEGSGLRYGFQSDDGKFFLVILAGIGGLLWKHVDGRSVGTLVAAAAASIVVMIAAGLELESIVGVDRARLLGDGGTVGESWGLVLVILGGLGAAVGSGLLALELSGRSPRPLGDDLDD
jgi:hypothetical protein